MNTVFKVVFSRARGALMVVNEVTSSVQGKGTKTVIATAVAAALTCGTAMAVEHNYDQAKDGFSATTTENPVMELAKGDVLTMNVTTDKRAYGLLATGKDHKYTNLGAINVTTTTPAKGYKVKAMMADMGGTAINDGAISVKNAYGMTVGSSKGEGTANTIINNNTITVNGGVGMEIAPTGAPGTSGTATAVGTNNGTIDVKSGIGMLVSGDKGVITNNGTIKGSATGNAIFVHTEEGKTADGNTIVLGANSVTNGLIGIGDNVTNTTIAVENGAVLNGRIVVNKTNKGVKGTKLQGTMNVDGLKLGSLGGVVAFQDGSQTSVIELTDSNFTNNVAGQGADYGWGGVFYTYAASFKHTGGSYVGNKALSVGANLPQQAGNCDGAFGGALMIKGISPVIFTDVRFENNSATATKTSTTTGGGAFGGAIYADYSTGNNGDQAGNADLIFKVTAGKSLAYTGNTVSSDSTSQLFDTYDYHVPTPQAGGFLFLDRGASAAFNVAENSTLTLGASVTSDDTDSIASSIPNVGATDNGGKHALIKKEGAGTLVVNSSLNKYYGTVDVNAGRMEVNSQWNLTNAVNVNAGSTLALADFNLLAADKTNNQDVNGNALAGKLTVIGTLETSSAEIFTNALDAEGTVKTVGETVYTAEQLVVQGGTLALNDAKYNLEYAQNAGTKFADGHVVMLGQLVGAVDNTQTLDQLENVGGNVELPNVTVDGQDKNIQVGGTLATGEEATTSHRTEDLAVGAIDLGKATTVTVAGNKTLALAGNGGEIVKSSDPAGASVVVEDGTLALGGVGAKGGTLASVEVQADGKVTVTGSETFTLENVKGAGNVLVGNAETAGSVDIKSLDGMTGMIFFDPDWKAGENSVRDAGKSSITGDIATAYPVIARNNVIATDATTDEAVKAYESIAGAQGLKWKDNVKTALYVGKQLKLGATAGVLLDGELANSADTPARVNGTVVVTNQGMLIVNQANTVPAVDGNVDIKQNGYLGVVNAAVGEFALTTDTHTVTSAGTVYTDNPFIQGSVSGNKVVNTLDAGSGLSAVASTGVQAMTRRADFVMAQTIADRTSIDQEMNPGVNLWVDVTGERYETDDLENGANFRVDAGYAAFGGDVALTNDLTTGLAFQYGTGSLRSGVSSIKNDITSYGLTAYASQKFGAAKLVGELAYLQSENEVTSSQAAMNFDVDAKIYSAGLRAQYQLTAGNFQFVPSVGLRVSRLETDAMKVGTINMADQEQTIVQMPIALRINGFEQNVSGWSVAPSFKLAYVPTFGDKDIQLLGYEQDVLDMSPVQADFGIRALNGNMMINANMLLGGGEAGTSSIGGKVGLKYVF